MEYISCANCGSTKFRSGEIQLCPEGGYEITMPCADCGQPSATLKASDPTFAKLLMEFFGKDVSA